MPRRRSKPPLVAVQGRVFDVSSKWDVYGPGALQSRRLSTEQSLPPSTASEQERRDLGACLPAGKPMNAWAGQEVARALAKGSSEVADFTADLSGLSQEEVRPVARVQPHLLTGISSSLQRRGLGRRARTRQRRTGRPAHPLVCQPRPASRTCTHAPDPSPACMCLRCWLSRHAQLARLEAAVKELEAGHEVVGQVRRRAARARRALHTLPGACAPRPRTPNPPGGLSRPLHASQASLPGKPGSALLCGPQVVPLREVSAAELARHDGSEPSLPLLISIKGVVYDVSKGKEYYGPDGAGGGAERRAGPWVCSPHAQRSCCSAGSRRGACQCACECVPVAQGWVWGEFCRKGDQEGSTRAPQAFTPSRARRWRARSRCFPPSCRTATTT
jgi:predicted heme/steroid binding protein